MNHTENKNKLYIQKIHFKIKINLNGGIYTIYTIFCIARGTTNPAGRSACEAKRLGIMCKLIMKVIIIMKSHKTIELLNTIKK